MRESTWVKGMPSPNPGGRPPYAFTYQRFVDRSSYLMEKYDIDQILDLAKDNKKLAKAVSYHDGMIVKRMARALEDDKTMERMLDRLLGKAVMRIGGENPGEPIKIATANVVRYEVLDDETLELLAGAFRTAKERQAELIESSVVNIEGDDNDKQPIE